MLDSHQALGLPIDFATRRDNLLAQQAALFAKKNTPADYSNGVYQRWTDPVVTAAHAPLNWRYDFNPETNPYFMERIGVNAALNAGAIYWQGKHLLILRVEGSDRKSFFAVAESENGVDGFQFWPEPVTMPPAANVETNAYDMRITAHEDGWLYGLFCAERKDMTQPNDISAADAQCGIARTKDFKTWERLPDLKTPSSQQRNVVLHPEFVDGKYGLYTRPQDGFITVGAGGGIGWAVVDSMTDAVAASEQVMEPKVYHSIKEMKNGQGPAPIKTDIGWLHLAHGVRNTAAGLRYVLYMFVSDLKEPWKVTHRPGGMFLGPEGEERVGDVSNVAFCNGWSVDEKGRVFIYYASSDTRMHVATTTIDQLVDYCLNTPEDALTSSACVTQRLGLIHANKAFGA